MIVIKSTDIRMTDADFTNSIRTLLDVGLDLRIGPVVYEYDFDKRQHTITPMNPHIKGEKAQNQAILILQEAFPGVPMAYEKDEQQQSYTR